MLPDGFEQGRGAVCVDAGLITGGPAPVSFRFFESNTCHQGDRIWQRYASRAFKRDAVRIAQTSGLTPRQVASDLGIGPSTLGNWVMMFSEEAKVPAQDSGLLRENERLRKENRILREEREVQKSGDVLRGSKAVKFQYIADYSGSLTRSYLCRLMEVTERGLHAWKYRPPSHRQRRDMSRA